MSFPSSSGKDQVESQPLGPVSQGLGKPCTEMAKAKSGPEVVA